MSIRDKRIIFQGTWSGKKRVDAYFRKLRQVFWKEIRYVQFKERLRDYTAPSYRKTSQELLLGHLYDGVVTINPNTQDHDGIHDVGKILVHELLHAIAGRGVSEKIIERREEYLWNTFSSDQRSYFYICLFAKLRQPRRGIRIRATIPK